MDIQILREFCDLAYTLNFNKTAERMFIGQSTLSKHIMSLENEWGIQLFVRTKQGVRLTQIGSSLLPIVTAMISKYDDCLTTIQKSKGDISGELRIGFLDTAFREFLTKSILLFRKQYPNMHIILESFQVGDMMDAFKNNAIDVALSIMFPNTFLPPDTVFKTFYEDGISAVIPQNHPLLQKEELTFDDILQYPLILPSHKMFSSYAQMISTYVNASPYPANIICDYTHIDTALIMVEAEMGVSILPTNIKAHPTTAVFKQISDCNPTLKIGAMWKKNNNTQGLPEFLEILINEVPEINKLTE